MKIKVILKRLPVLGSDLKISKTVKVFPDCNLRKAQPNKYETFSMYPNLFDIVYPNIDIIV